MCIRDSAGYETSNQSEKLLPDGSTLLDKDCFIYGGALTLELEALSLIHILRGSNLEELITEITYYIK